MEKSEFSLWVPNGALSQPLSCTSGLWEEEECGWFPLVRVLLKDLLGFLEEVLSFFPWENLLGFVKLHLSFSVITEAKSLSLSPASEADAAAHINFLLSDSGI